MPEVYKQPEEFKALLNTESQFVNRKWINAISVYNDSFIDTSSEYGIIRRENYLNIVPNANDSLDTRRFILKSRYQEQAPYTNRVLIRLLNSLLGEGRYMYQRDAVNKRITIGLELTVASQYNAVVSLLERIVPVNMELVIQLRYNTYNQLRPFTHNQLNARTHNELREVSI